MRNIKFTKNGKYYKQVTKETARKLFNKGKTLLIAPSYYNCLTGGAGLDFELNKNNFDRYKPDDFDACIDHYAALNCGGAVGKYVVYYVEV